MASTRPLVVINREYLSAVAMAVSSRKTVQIQNVREHPSKVVLSDLPVLRCVHCDIELVTFKRKNYFYGCENCQLEWELPSMLPHWDELFAYSGFGLPTDTEQFAVYSGPNPLVITLPGQKRVVGGNAA
jgi:hypothetical protein